MGKYFDRFSTGLRIGRPDSVGLIRNSIFNEARCKLYRARCHAHEVSLLWEQAVEHHFTSIFVAETQPFSSAPWVVPIPFEIPLAIGDCIRNLRTALDYLVAAMARQAGLSDKQIVFPFEEEREKVIRSFDPAARKGVRQRALFDIFRKYPEIKGVILDEIQPFSCENGAKVGGDLLWRTITSDNIDKHRLMVPRTTKTNMKKVVKGGITFHNCQAYGANAIEIAGVGLNHFDPESEFTTDMLFWHPSRLAGRPVLSTLLEAGNQVAIVIEKFESKFGIK